MYRHCLEEILQVLGHALLADGFPSLLQKNHLADTFQPTHLVNEGLHNDDGHYREEYLVVLDVIQLEDDKPLVQEVQLLVGVQEEIILATLVIWFQDIEESPHIEVLLACTLFLENLLILVTDKLVEGIERGLDALVSADTLQEEVHGIGECHLLGSRRWFIVPFPQREDKRLDGLLLLYIEYTILDIERIEGYRVALLVGEIDAVLAMRACIDKVA